jgi:alpha-galactosidase
LLTPEKERAWKKWFSLYNEKMLSKEPYLGQLYDIGYDLPEAHAIQKGNIMYYAFYAEKWDGVLELRGLHKGKRYKVRDYINGKEWGQVTAENPSLKVAFEQSLLLEVSAL